MRKIAALSLFLWSSTSQAMDAPVANSCIGNILRSLLAHLNPHNRQEANPQVFGVTHQPIVDFAEDRPTSLLGIPRVSASLTLNHALAGQPLPYSDDRWPLHNFAYHNQVLLANHLLKKGALVDELDESGQTASHVAAQSGGLQVLQLFLKHGARINMQNAEGKTPIHYAAINGFLDITQCLISESFFPPSWRPKRVNHILNTARGSEYKRIKNLFTIINNVNDACTRNKSIAEQTAINQLASMVAPENARLIAGLVMLKHQQEMIKQWSEDASDAAAQRKELLLEAHCERHLEKIQQAIALKDKEGKTAHDRAIIPECMIETIVDVSHLLRKIKHAKTVANLPKNIQEILVKNIRLRLTGNFHQEYTPTAESIMKLARLR